MARLFLPAGTNYFTNPSFETDSNADGQADGITNSGSGTPTFTRPAGRLGGYCQRMQLTADADNETLTLIPADRIAGWTAGDSITCSWYIKGSMGAGVIVGAGVHCYDAANAFVSSLNIGTPTLSESWTRFSGTGTIPATATQVKPYIQFSNVDTGISVDFYADDFLVEKSSVLTPYFDGSTDDSLNDSTYAWSGTANASTSTRATSALCLPAVSGIASAATISLRMVPLWAGGDNLSHYFLAAYSDTNNKTLIYKDTGNRITGSVKATDTVSIQSAAQSFAAGSIHHVTYRHSAAGNTQDLMFDGTASAQVTSKSPTAYTDMHFGSSTGGLAGDSIYIGPVIISPARKPDAWVTAVDAYLRGTAIDIEYIKKNFMAPGDALFTGRQIDGSNLFVKGS